MSFLFPFPRIPPFTDLVFITFADYWKVYCCQTCTKIKDKVHEFPILTRKNDFKLPDKVDPVSFDFKTFKMRIGIDEHKDHPEKQFHPRKLFLISYLNVFSLVCLY